jgi:hypothetical protein
MTDQDGDGMIDPASPADLLETVEELGRSLRRAATLTAGMGIAFSVLFTVALVLTTSIPGPKASNDELIAYYAAGGTSLPVAIGLYLMPFAGIAFLWFIVALRMWSAASVRHQSVLQSNLQLVSGILFVALFFIGAAASSVLAVSLQFAEGPVDPVTARQFPIFGQTVVLFFAMRMAAMFVFTTSAIGRSARILPRWFALAGFLVGLFLLLSASFTPLLILVFPAWVLILSVFLMGRARSIPRDVRLPRRAGIGLMDPLGTYKRPDGGG